MMVRMDRTQPFRFGPGSYPCQNPRCHIAYHPIPTCPYQLPEPSRPFASRVGDGRRRIEQLEREGRLPPVEPIPMWWIWLIPPALVILLLLMLF
jgi:hypothetical protein